MALVCTDSPIFSSLRTGDKIADGGCLTFAALLLELINYELDRRGLPSSINMYMDGINLVEIAWGKTHMFVPERWIRTNFNDQEFGQGLELTRA